MLLIVLGHRFARPNLRATPPLKALSTRALRRSASGSAKCSLIGRGRVAAASAARAPVGALARRARSFSVLTSSARCLRASSNRCSASAGAMAWWSRKITVSISCAPSVRAGERSVAVHRCRPRPLPAAPSASSHRPLRPWLRASTGPSNRCRKALRQGVTSPGRCRVDDDRVGEAELEREAAHAAGPPASPGRCRGRVPPSTTAMVRSLASCGFCSPSSITMTPSRPRPPSRPHGRPRSCRAPPASGRHAPAAALRRRRRWRCRCRRPNADRRGVRHSRG